MTEPTHLAALYNAAEIILWVEDRITAAYLGALWEHPSWLHSYIGGGHETLEAVVKAARDSGRRGVYSLRDRDFGPTNRSRWSSPDVVSFALDTFELECFLLDPPALAACAVNTGRRSAAEIGARLTTRAGEVSWWMACRKAIAGLRDDRQAHFPAHPTRALVQSRESAERYLLGNEWVKTTAPGLAERVKPDRLRDELLAAHEHYAGHVAAGTWASVFSGKELLGEILGWVYTRNPGGETGYEDLAKAVALAQRVAGRAPPELLELRDALLARRTV